MIMVIKNIITRVKIYHKFVYTKNCSSNFLITSTLEGNFHMVQNFVVFMDRSAAVKVRILT